MPSRKNDTPEHIQPSDRDLLAVLYKLTRRSPSASLRQIAGEVWPDLAWSAAGGADSAQRTRRWPGGERTTAGMWLADRLQRLVLLGALRHGPRRRDEVDTLASLSYALGSAGAIDLFTPKSCPDCCALLVPGAVHRLGCTGMVPALGGAL